MSLRGSFVLALNVLIVRSQLWPKGVVHYAINQKDYDAHSQAEIAATLSRLEREVCVKFFHTPLSFNATREDKILYIHNQDQRKACPPDQYYYGGSVVDMTIGYKCVNEREIARIVVDMLRASVRPNVSPVNSFDLVKKFQEREDAAARPALLAPADRGYINAHYVRECARLQSRPGLHRSYRRTGGTAEDLDILQMSEENKQFYNSKLWPLGIVMYGVQHKLRGTPAHELLKQAMASVELDSCLVFQDAEDAEGVLAARSLLWFAEEGADAPALGFRGGNQTVSLQSTTHGAGSPAHPIMSLLRAAGVPMASNRPDRDNYLEVHWQNVVRGQEHYLERYPEAGWIKRLPYDFDSVTHAPADFACGDACAVGGTTVEPLQDHLWQRRMSMGRATELSETDRLYLKTIYELECQKRHLPADAIDDPLVGNEYTDQEHDSTNPLPVVVDYPSAAEDDQEKGVGNPDATDQDSAPEGSVDGTLRGRKNKLKGVRKHEQ